MPTNQRKKKRRWFQVSLRTLLLLFLLSGLLLGVIGPRLHYARQQRRAVLAIAKHGGTINYSNASSMFDGIDIPKWLVELLGTDFFANADGVDFGSRKTTDASIGHLEPLVYLRTLRLSGASVTNSGLATLGRLHRLEVLELDGTTVNDAGLAQLSHLTKLRELDLRSTRVTEEGLLRLRQARQLEKLYIIDTQVTPSGVAQVREVFPDTKVYDRRWRTSGAPYP